MDIYVVQPKDTIQSIAEKFGVSVQQLIRDNGLTNPNNLVTGQSLVIAYPKIIHTVIEGDTLTGIASTYQVTIMQLLRNNPYLSESENLNPGDIIVIQYNTMGNIVTHGNTIPYINKTTLRKTLPYLTYLSILNYTAAKQGEIISYYDDTEIIRIAKEYSVKPLLLLTTLSLQGEANIGIAYEILLNEAYQDKQIDYILNVLNTKGYYGVNLSFEYINSSNLKYYESYFTKISERLSAQGYPVFTTINTNITFINNEVTFQRVNYSVLDQLAQNIIFMNYEWATSINPPSPISSIYNIDIFLNFVSNYISPAKEIIGLATIGYDWELPFSAGLTSVRSLTLERAIELASSVGATIQFDEVSQTPYFSYELSFSGNQISHIVWFIDARSINALLDLGVKYNLQGTGIWNITIYNPQLWLIINSQFEIIKI